ncbi:MAG: A/G-specific adenine glycosylase [Chloroflexi bacterium]|nr:A/G-specific adenine glycosylase [Chloroflexota bacterium]
MTVHTDIQPARLSLIQASLLEWFAANARDLPWRRTRDPYAFLVSEVMLQQTQVDRVLPYYTRFLERFPTVHNLAAAPTAEVIRLWSGLGYNRRAVNLQRAAVVIVNELEGRFPDDPVALKKLPGIGSYTAGAISAFAYERDVAFLDTNMRRVISRVVFGSESVTESEALQAAEALVPLGHGWTWNQAQIEFGALHCTARRPACIVCPLRDACAAFPTMQATLGSKRSQVRKTIVPFENTTRYYRGRIVETLRGLPEHDQTGIALTELGSIVQEGFAQENIPWLRGIVEGLQRDGLAVIAEDPVPYDASAEAAGSGLRVRLP